MSSNGRYFLDQDGHPILVKGDSPWAILVNSSTASMDRYLETHAGQGFNVALVSLVGNTANGGPSDSGATYDGVPPFVGGDPTRLNGAYWDRVDHFISKAASLGITVMAFPLDGWNGTSTFGGLAAGWSTTTAQAYGKALAARLSGHPNLIYATGGDFPNSNGGADDDRFWAVLTGLATAGAQRLETIQFERGETSLDSTFWDEKVQYNFVYPHALTYALLENAYRTRTLPATTSRRWWERPTTRDAPTSGSPTTRSARRSRGR